MIRFRNKYCSNCLRTMRFLILESVLVCERCSKRLERKEKPCERAITPNTKSSTGSSAGIVSRRSREPSSRMTARSTTKRVTP